MAPSEAVRRLANTLDSVQKALKILPDTLPLEEGSEFDVYKFDTWSADTSVYGSTAAALLAELEDVFPKSAPDAPGPIPFVLRARGPRLEAVTDALLTAYESEANGSESRSRLIDWMGDIARVAGHYHTEARLARDTERQQRTKERIEAWKKREQQQELGSHTVALEEEESSGDEGEGGNGSENDEEGSIVGDDDVEDSDGNVSDIEESGDDEGTSEEDEEPAPKRTKVSGKPGEKPKVKKASTAESRKKARRARKKPQNVNVYADFESASESEVQTFVSGRRRGRPPNMLLFELTEPCRRKGDPKKRKMTRCIGMKPNANGAGCDTTFAWGNGKSGRQRNRILAHSANCAFIPGELRERARMAIKPKAPTQKKIDAQAKLNGATKQSGDGFVQTSILPASNAAKREALKAVLDEDTVRLVTVHSLPFRVAGSTEYKRLLAHATGDKYTPPSATTISDTLIPSQAAYAVDDSIAILKSHDNLTITFDGATTRGQDSVYTIHVITPDRQVFLIKGSSNSADSHTGEYLAEKLCEVIKLIGPLLFSGICSDDTGNTRVGRETVQEKWPWIIQLADCCHRLSNTAKDIGQLSIFEECILTSRRVVTFFHKSTFAMTAFRRVAPRHGVDRGFQSAGITRFAGIVHMASSVKRCLPVVYDLLEDPNLQIKIPDVNPSFVRSSVANGIYVAQLSLLIKVLMPIAYAITCLESTHSTVADVFMFWLAVMAQFESFLASSASDDLSADDKDKIRRILNARWRQMIVSPSTNGPEDTVSVYVVGFMLHPGYRDSLGLVKLAKLNPLSSGTITIPGLQPMASSSSLPDIAHRVAVWLVDQLRIQYTVKQCPIDGLDAEDALTELNAQFVAFTKNAYPFKRALKKNETPLQFWQSLRHGHESRVLAFFAIKLFSILCNSMPDERTGSVMTRIGTALRGSLKPARIVEIVQCRQFFQRIDEKESKAGDKKIKIPTVKFHKLGDTLERLRARAEPLTSESTATAPAESTAAGDGVNAVGNSDSESDIEHDDSEPEPLVDLESEHADRLDAQEWVQSKQLSGVELLDFLSDKPLAGAEKAPEKATSRTAKKTAPVQGKLVWAFRG